MNRKEYLNNWKIQNKEKLKSYSKKYRDANKEIISKRMKEKRRADSKKMYMRDYRSRHATVERSLTTLFNHIKKASWKRGARDKNRSSNDPRLELNITPQYLINLWNQQNGCCAITKYQMTYQTGSLYSVSIDRIDNSKGYIVNNIQLVCKAINLAKGKHTNIEIIEFWNHKLIE